MHLYCHNHKLTHYLLHNALQIATHIHISWIESIRLRSSKLLNTLKNTYCYLPPTELLKFDVFNVIHISFNFLKLIFYKKAMELSDDFNIQFQLRS